MSDYRLNSAGYLQHRFDPRRYQHRDVWIEANGPIPEGHHIHHLNGNKSDNRLENLQCLSSSEHRSIHANTPENKAWILSVRDGEERSFACAECGAMVTTRSRVKKCCSKKCTMKIQNRELSKRRLLHRHGIISCTRVNHQVVV